ncbi:MAG: heme exporter protein CcmD [Candidatus Puniceispirillaceae bacterium]|jgi:heme exporter protein CcmD
MAEFMAEFLAMGGFAGFVWPCYALSLGGMIWLGITSWHRARTAARQLAAMTGQGRTVTED